MSISAPDAKRSAGRGEVFWRTVFENPVVGVAVVGPDRRFRETNQRFRELVGYSRDELRAMTVLELTHPADRPEHVKTAERLRSGKARDVHIEKRYLKKDGGTVRVRVTALLAPDSGESGDWAIALVEDVTEQRALVDRLEATERQFRDAQAIARFGTWEWNPVSDTAVWSDELYRIFGLDRANFRPTLLTYLERVVPEDRDSTRLHIETAFASGREIDYENRVVRPDGSIRIFRHHGAAERDETGEIRRVLGVVQDVTERRQAELDVIQKEARLRLVVDQMQAILWTTDRELRFTSSFGAGLRGLGLRSEEVVGRSVFDFSERPESDEVLAHRRALAGESSTYSATYSGRSFQAHVEPLKDETGEVVGVIGVCFDNSEQRRAEEMLRESESRYRELFESNPSPMWVHDAETFAFLAVNEAAVRHYGYSRQEFLSLKASEIQHPAEVRRWLEQASRLPEVAGGGTWRHRKKDGTGVVSDVMARAIDFAGRSARLVLVRDVTDRRRAQERLARSEREMRALTARLQTIREEEDSRVARAVHDEIGQALTALGLDVAWLANNFGRPRTRTKFAEKLRTMAALIEETTGSVERIASDLRPGILDEVGLGAAAEWAVGQFRDRTGIDCAFESNVSDDFVDLGVATAIFRILQEALTNVARHAHARHLEVRLRTEEGQIHLEVSDDGAGMDPARIADSRSFGFLGMRERARALGGNCVIAARASGGTLVVAAIPLATAAP